MGNESGEVNEGTCEGKCGLLQWNGLSEKISFFMGQSLLEKEYMCRCFYFRNTLNVKGVLHDIHESGLIFLENLLGSLFRLSHDQHCDWTGCFPMRLSLPTGAFAVDYWCQAYAADELLLYLRYLSLRIGTSEGKSRTPRLVNSQWTIGILYF